MKTLLKTPPVNQIWGAFIGKRYINVGYNLFSIMVIEGLRTILDIKGLIDKYGRFVPILLFVYLAYIEPTPFHFIFLGISIILCLIPSYCIDDVMKYFNKDGSPKFKLIYSSNKKMKFFFLCSIFFIYLALLFYTLFLLIQRVQGMISTEEGDIFLIILLLMNIGAIVVIFFPFFKQIKRNIRAGFKLKRRTK